MSTSNGESRESVSLLQEPEWQICTMCHCGDKTDDHWMVAQDIWYTNIKKRMAAAATNCSGELSMADAKALAKAKNDARK